MSAKSTKTISRNILLGLAVTILLVTGSFLAGRAVSAQEPPRPGSEEDPLAARSYVDQLSRWRLVNVPSGCAVIGSEGTEFILRAGQAKAIASTLGGLADLTAGLDIGHHGPIGVNHLLVVPRTDGRGLLAVTELILLVRGECQIEGGSR